MMYQVPLFGQTYLRSCWAASIRMILAWSGRTVASDDDIAAPTGHAGSLQSGLSPDDAAPLRHWGFALEAPQTYTEAGITALLRAHGPLWIAADMRTPGFGCSAPHMRVIRGLRNLQSPTALAINDPGPVGNGSQYDETYAELVRKNESLTWEEMTQPAPIYVAYLR